VLGERPAEALLGREVHPAHRLGVPVVPAPGAAHRDHGVDPAAQRRLPEHHAGAHREPDRDDLGVAEAAGVPDRHVEVVDLLVTEGGEPAGPAVAAEVEGHHAAGPVEALDDGPHHRPLPGQSEAVRDHEREVRPPGRRAGQRELLRVAPLGRGQVHGVDRDAIVGDQGGGHDDGFHRAPSGAGVRGRLNGNNRNQSPSPDMPRAAPSGTKTVPGDAARSRYGRNVARDLRLLLGDAHRVDDRLLGRR
jgi:hypothetical protein